MHLSIIIDSTTIIGLVALAQAITLMLFLIAIYPRSADCWLFCCLLAAITIALGHDVLLYSRLVQFVPQIIGFGPFSTYLSGPIVFLITLRILWPEKTLSWWQALNFVPFGAHLLSRWSHYFANTDDKVTFLTHFYQNAVSSSETVDLSANLLWNSIVYYGHRFVYIGMSLFFLHKFKANIQYAITARTQFYQIFRIALMIYCLGWLIIKSTQYVIGYDSIAVNATALSISVIALAFLLFKYGLNDIFSSRTTLKYKRTPMDESITESLVEVLNSLMKKEGWYCDNALNQATVAQRSGYSTQQISQALNSHGVTFNEFVNQHRLTHFLSALQQPENQNKDMLQLALDSGFNSKATFYRVFKDKTGVTPSQYKKQMR